MRNLRDVFGADTTIVHALYARPFRRNPFHSSTVPQPRAIGNARFYPMERADSIARRKPFSASDRTCTEYTTEPHGSYRSRGGAGNGTPVRLRRPGLRALPRPRTLSWRTLARSLRFATSRFESRRSIAKSPAPHGYRACKYIGAGNGTRTRGCQLGKLMPYHLAMPACWDSVLRRCGFAQAQVDAYTIPWIPYVCVRLLNARAS